MVETTFLPYVPYVTMVERMVVLTYNSGNVHGVVDDNSNSSRNMVVNARRMNQGHNDQFSIIDEELNVDAVRFFDLLKILTNHYRIVAQITVNY